VLSHDPVIIYDGAHNPQGIDMFVKSVKTYFGDKKMILVSTVMGDKDYESMVADLASVADSAYIFKVNDRALAADEYAKVYEKYGVRAYSCCDMKEALSRAIEQGKQTNNPVICAGSLYMYADVVSVIDGILK
jgi:dihydrofolate synthase/folylpolyglutamate synthase